jgi:hypothetical protein
MQRFFIFSRNKMDVSKQDHFINSIQLSKEPNYGQLFSLAGAGAKTGFAASRTLSKHGN